MENKKTGNVASEVKDEELDAVSGGAKRRMGERMARCQRCREEVPVLSLLGGYCGSCLDELHNMGVYPPI